MSRPLLVAAILALATASAPAVSATSVVGDDALSVVIAKLFPKAKILRAAQVDTESCGKVADSPGLVRADFNGDGLEDAVAILVTNIVRESKHWNGKEYRDANFRIVLFLNDGKGGYVVRELGKFTNQIPATLL